MQSRRLLFNTILLTATSLLMRSVGLAFQVYLSNKIGASGVGLFILIMTVSMMASTFAVSGIRFATVRLISEQLGVGSGAGVKKAVRRCLIYAVFFGTAAAVILFTSANYIGTSIISDTRTISALKILSFSLPFLSMGSVLSGYFTAVCRVIKSALVQIVEQAVRIGIVIFIFSIITVSDIEQACAAVVLGGIVGEIISFLLLLALYITDVRVFSSRTKAAPGISRRMLGIALPLAVSAYTRTVFSSIQNLLVPKGLKKSGIDYRDALAGYGMIQGMVFPVITFPSALFMSLAELLVPELTDAQVKNQTNRIEQTVNRILRLCLLFSIGVMGVLLYYSGQLGESIYKSSQVGGLIRAFALLMPIMYLDTVTDGMLRGLGEHMFSMRVNIVDSFLSAVLVYIFLPKYAVNGYIFIIYFSEVFNFTLSICRLAKVTRVKMKITVIVKALVSAVGAINLTILLMRILGAPLSAEPINLIFHILLSLCEYAMLLKIFGAIEQNDIELFKLLTGSEKKRKKI